MAAFLPINAALTSLWSNPYSVLTRPTEHINEILSRKNEKGAAWK